MAHDAPDPDLLKLSRPLWPALPGYARNLLVATDVARRRDDDGKLVVLGKKLFMHVVESEIEPLDGEDDPERRFRRFVIAASARLIRPAPAAQPFRRNLRTIGDIAGLSRVDRRVLQFLLAVRMASSLEQVTDCFTGLTLDAAVRLVALATAERLEEVRRAVRPRGRLVASGLVTIQPLPDFIERKLPISTVLPDLVTADRLNRADVLEAFSPLACFPPRNTEDLMLAVPGADLLRDLLAGAAAAPSRGVNILLHGRTGSGKSDLARAAARQAGLELRQIRPGGPFPSGESRLPVLTACDNLVRDRRSVFLFDDIEDVLEPHAPPGPGHLGARTSRAWFEHRLETNVVPTIWTATDATRIDPALRRRFCLVLEVPSPDEAARSRVWDCVTLDEDALSPGERAELAARVDASRTDIVSAVETARIARGGAADAATVSAIFDAALRASGEGVFVEKARPAAYRPECIHASADVESIARRLSSWTRADGGVALLLHGPPGTGKSEWVHELGRRLRRPVLARRASDIESKWVGESEQNLARAFREAAERGAVLLFDEVDTFLLDRSGASWTHELRLTNEFLQQLDAHANIVACTTNLLDRLDPAVLRRCPLKVEFRPSTPAQAAALFEAYFSPALGDEAMARARPRLESQLAAAGALTPGDFAAVARRTRVTGEIRTAEDAVRLLREEVALRSKGTARAMGFAPHAANEECRPAPRLAEAATLDREA